MQGEFLDHRVSEQFAGELLKGRERRTVGRPRELELEPLSLPHSGHGAEAQAM